MSTSFDPFLASSVSWKPPEGVTEHNGEPLKECIDFFAPPPPSIGDILTVHSTLTAGKEPMSSVTRLLLAFGIGALFGGGVAAALVYGKMDDRGMIALISGLTFLVIGGIAYAAFGFKHTVTYVGKLGIAKITCSGGREVIRQDIMFLYTEAAELRTKQTRQFVNGVYSGTSYDFTWTNAQGIRVQRLNGTYHSKEGTPKAKDPFNFAQSAEFAWSDYLLDLAQAALDAEGSIRFGLGGNDFIKIGPGVIELQQKGKLDRLESAEIANVELGQGVFTVQRVGATKGFLGIGKSGYFSFEYGNMANARVFLLALDKLMHLRFQ